MGGSRALSSLLVLQVPQGPSKPKGGAVEEASPQVEGEQEAAVPGQRARPGGQVAAADGQHVLRATPAEHGVAAGCSLWLLIRPGLPARKRAHAIQWGVDRVLSAGRYDRARLELDSMSICTRQ